jgi:hypothetical protein
MSLSFNINVHIQQATHFAINNRPTPHFLYVSIQHLPLLSPRLSMLTGNSPPRKITPKDIVLFKSISTRRNLSIYGSIVLLLDRGRFFRFLVLYTVGKTPWNGDQPLTRPLLTYKTTQSQSKHASSGVRTHDPNFQKSEDSSCLRPRGPCDRHS